LLLRLGHYKGAVPGQVALNKALALLLEAIPVAASRSNR
jgi:hypothetical protein